MFTVRVEKYATDKCNGPTSGYALFEAEKLTHIASVCIAEDFDRFAQDGPTVVNMPDGYSGNALELYVTIKDGHVEWIVFVRCIVYVMNEHGKTISKFVC